VVEHLPSTLSISPELQKKKKKQEEEEKKKRDSLFC
jgi:hypothetical protein